MPHLFRNIIPNVWNVPHSKKGIKAWALFCFLDIRFIWESVVMSDSSKEHLNTDNKVLQQQHQHHHQPYWILHLVLQAKSTMSLFKNNLSINSCLFPHKTVLIFSFSKIMIFDPFIKTQNARSLTQFCTTSVTTSISWPSTMYSLPLSKDLEEKCRKEKLSRNNKI